MQSEMFKGFEKFNQSTLESVRRLGEINSRALQRLGERQLEATNDYLEGGMKHLQLLSAIKGPQDMVSGQSRLLSELNQKLVDHVRKTTDILLETRGELNAWVEDGIKLASESPFAKAAGKASSKVSA